MKIAYFIMAHHKPLQLINLMNAIYNEDNIYLIHIDLKADTEMQTLAYNLASANENIHLLPSRSVTWACWSLVQVELDAIKQLLYMDQEWQYYINLSGQDMPLLRQTKIKEFLEERSGRNFLTVERVLNDQEKDHQSHYWVEDCGKMANLGRRNAFEEYFVAGMKPYTGAQWKILHRQFAEYSVNSPLAFDMQDYFRYSYLPDEIYFQTLIMNSSFKHSLVSKNYRYLKMDTGNTFGYHRPVTVTSDMMYELYSSDALFARKFDPEVDSNIIQIIESTLKV